MSRKYKSWKKRTPTNRLIQQASVYHADQPARNWIDGIHYAMILPIKLHSYDFYVHNLYWRRSWKTPRQHSHKQLHLCWSTTTYGMECNNHPGGKHYTIFCNFSFSSQKKFKGGVNTLAQMGIHLGHTHYLLHLLTKGSYSQNGLHLSEWNNQQYPSSVLRPLKVRSKEAQNSSQVKDTSFSETTHFLQHLKPTRFENNSYFVY